MTFHARVDGFIALTLAEIDIDRIALVVGPNAAGKSALVDGIACAVTGSHGARDVTAKKDMKALLHDGYRQAQAQIWDNDGNSASMHWPTAEHLTAGGGIHVDPISAGRARLTDLKPSERGDLIWRITASAITPEDIAEALRAARIPEGAIGPVLDHCKKDGIDAALHYYKQKRTKQKGVWEAATGESYGISKATDWAPTDWTHDLDKETEAGLQAAIDAARRDLDQAIGEGAVSQERRGALEHAAAGLGQAQAAFNLATSDLDTYQTQLDTAAEERAKLPESQPHGHVKCPKCGVALKIESKPAETRISLANEGPEIDPEELKQIRLQIADLDGKISRLRGQVGTAEQRLAGCRATLSTATQAHEQLQGLSSAETGEQDLASMRTALGVTEGRLRLFQVKARADAAQRQIAGLNIVTLILGPDGLKRTKIRAALDLVNTELAAMSKAMADFPTISIDDNFVVRAEARPFGLLSAGYQFAANAIIQVALARLQKAALVLIDGAEVLAGESRGALLKMVVRSELPAVIAMAVKRPDDVPDLAKMKLGKTYWIEDGRARPVSE